MNTEEAGWSLTISARFEYSATAFDKIAGPESEAFLLDTEKDGAETSGDEDNSDPVDSMQLHCIWPSFPHGSFVDNATYSELDPKLAPHWKLRVVGVRPAMLSQMLPVTEMLKSFLRFRAADEGAGQPPTRSTLASLGHVLQQSFVSISLPSPVELAEYTEECLLLPIVAHPTTPSRLHLAGRGTRLAKLVELSAKMRSSRGVMMLWRSVLSRMRNQWEMLEVTPPHALSPDTHRILSRGVRTEVFDSTNCLIQQKFEMLQRTIEEKRRGFTTTGMPELAGFATEGTGEPVVTPELMWPLLLTGDMVEQRDLAETKINDPEGRAELHGREMRSDMAAFKAANPRADLGDFVAWRNGLDLLDVFPRSWLDRTWKDVQAQPVTEQSRCLFEPEREAEMTFHYLDTLDSAQVISQFARVLTRIIIEDLGEGLEDSPYLCHLRETAVTAACSVFLSHATHEGESSTVDQYDHLDEAALQATVAAVEALESSRVFALSLKEKLPRSCCALLEELLSEGEAIVATSEQRRAIEAMFQRSRSLTKREGEVLGDLPLSKEFVFLFQPAGGVVSPGDVKRMYAEIKESHLRIAVVRGIPLV